ncbi:hypothetical protein Q8E21_003108 [Vibrio vulnificus]|nr:hypothetical protein [Vibrio vulnificus]
MHKVCLAGNGWGAIAALNSLKRVYSSLYIVTDDIDVISQMREQDILVEGINVGKYDVIVCSGYQPIIPQDVIDNNRIINIHYSLLPKYRGMHSTVWAIINGESELGLTIHEINEFIDDGDIIFQHRIEYKDQTSTEIMEHCNRYVEDNLSNLVLDYVSGNIDKIVQDKSLASWVCKRNIDDCKLDFSLDLKLIKRFFKALSFPYPRPFFIFNGKRLTIEKADFVENGTIMTFGRVVNVDTDGVWIQVKNGYLIASLIKDESGEIFNNESIKIGSRL